MESIGFHRPVFEHLLRRVEEPRRFIQVLSGPSHVGKTTLARQVLEATRLPSHYASADGLAPRDSVWLEQQWEAARLAAGPGRGALLILDEIHKAERWAETVKSLWDSDTAGRRPLRVVLLGSSPLLVRGGLTESLAGRFEVIPCTHWSFREMREAFGWGWERFVQYGGYPGAATLVEDEDRWRRYIVDSLIETTISRDILLLTRVDKPALLRQLFHLACEHSGQVLSYQKMLGQLHDAGNTTTLARYLDLLGDAGFVTGLQKFSRGVVRQRASSPKLQVFNTALATALAGRSFSEARNDLEYWGRLVESAVGAHLLNEAHRAGAAVHYWRERNQEVDFVLSSGRTVVAIEVKSGRRKQGLPGMAEFGRRFRPKRSLLVGGGGIPVEEFLGAPVEKWLAP